MEVLFAFLGGALLSAIITVFIVRAVVKARLETELGHARGQISQLEGRCAEVKADADRRLDELKAESANRLARLKEDAEKHEEKALAAKDEADKQAMKALQERFDETIAKLSAQMKSETSEMLKARQKEFAEASSQSIGQLVNPLKENIAELKKAMAEGSKEQAERNGELRERIKTLMEHSDAARKSADELAAAFKHGSKMQGDWGETILEELLSMQGLTRGVHYDTQEVICGPDGKPVRSETGGTLRPDVILHLDSRRELIIDSKVSLTSYIDYVNAENEVERQSALKAHVESLRKHVKELAAKDYSSYIAAPKVSLDYVLMFVPNTGALWTALNAEPDLWRRAAESKVYIVDEQTIFAALSVVKMTWTQIAQAQNHANVYALANEMIDRVGIFMDRYQAIGKSLKKAQEEYDEGMKKLLPGGKSILNTSNKLIELGAKDSEKHPVLPYKEIEE